MCCRLPPRRRRELVGLVFLALVIVTWVAQSELAQFIQVGTYNKPFFLTWCNHCFALVLLPVAALGFRLCVKPAADRRARARDPAAPGLRFDSRFLGVDKWWVFLARMFGVAAVYQLADYAWYLGLPLVSVTTGTVLFNVSCVYTYLISLACCLERHLSVYKVGGILLTVGGVLIVSGSQTDNNANNATADRSGGAAAALDAIGKACILSGALGYSVFEVAVSRINAAADIVRHQHTIHPRAVAHVAASPPGAARKGEGGGNACESLRPGSPALPPGSSATASPHQRRRETPHGAMVLTSIETEEQVGDGEESGGEENGGAGKGGARGGAGVAVKAAGAVEEGSAAVDGDRGLPGASGEFDELQASLLPGSAGARPPPAAGHHRETDDGVTIVISCFLTGMVGAVSLLTMWPGIVAVNYVPHDSLISEPFAWPSAGDTLLLFANGGLALAFNLFFMLALAFCNPIVVSVGCTLTIPLSALVDSLLYGDNFFLPLPLAGSGCVIAGFVICAWVDALKTDPSGLPLGRCCVYRGDDDGGGE